ncbi:1-phosphofructokinase family hexose kinase [Schumannella sp. 10F1B-5-1]|uniref:1-phosphofructokinase family hexose kinase n=1 Tax=Schumannella sp. 10F1B-5-1 TaxID=2590780 RepID=UPI00113170E6|nr:PfkB family carbohydrate kinase [Schumannella sp. 10F1B-5-1]TPW72793.1 hypothetical protein FJ658_05850 [Schumannella sp. 10F1B-5-1]
MTLIALAPSPALDVTHRVVALEPGEIHRPTEVVRLAGGKALNVVRAAGVLGLPARAVVPLGGRMGVVVAGLAIDEGLDVRAVPIAAEARQCLSLVPDEGAPTESYEPAPVLSEREARSLASAVGEELAGALAGEAIGSVAAAADAGDAPVWLAISGSLPAALVSALLPVVEQATAAGVRVAVDSSGDGLAALLDARPHLVKVNRAEAAGVVGAAFGAAGAAAGEDNATDAPLLELATALRDRAGRDDGLVVVTDGAHGALALNSAGAWLAHPDPEPGRFAVGSGDSFLAGFVAGLVAGEPTESALARASAAGSANTRSLGAARLAVADLDAAASRIRVEKLG